MKKRLFWKERGFIFIFNSSISNIRNSGNYLNCNCYISCSLAIQIADEHTSMSHLKWIYSISWLRKVPETVWLMLNLFCKRNHSRVIFSLSSSFRILFLHVWDLLLNHWNNFLDPFWIPSEQCREGKVILWDSPNLGISAGFVFSGAVLCVRIPKVPYQGDRQSGAACSSLQPYCRREQGEAAGPRRAELPPPSRDPRPVPAGWEMGCTSTARRGNETFSVKYPSEAGGGGVRVMWHNSRIAASAG